MRLLTTVGARVPIAGLELAVSEKTVLHTGILELETVATNGPKEGVATHEPAGMPTQGFQRKGSKDA